MRRVVCVAMRHGPDINRLDSGYCLAELLLVLGLLGICVAIGCSEIAGGLNRGEARASAQATQGAVAWAQLGVIWRGGDCQVRQDAEGLTVSGIGADEHSALGCLAPVVDTDSNLARWNTSEGFSVKFLSPFASPDGGGSIFFGSGDRVYKVTVRPESGVTTRGWTTR